MGERTASLMANTSEIGLGAKFDGVVKGRVGKGFVVLWRSHWWTHLNLEVKFLL